MKKQDAAVSNLKLRAGWGVVGNDRITNYLSLELYSQGKYGYGNNVITVLSPKQLPESIKWEAFAEHQHRYRPGPVPQPPERHDRISSSRIRRTC